MSNPIREMTRLMDKRAKQPASVAINIGASGPTSTEGNHEHDDRYYREAEVDTLLSTKSDTTHNHTLEELIDVPVYAGNEGKFIKVNATANGVEYDIASGGASAFKDLADVPASYVGQAGKVVAVKSTEDAVEFVNLEQATNGLPAGGTAGQILSKIDSTDYNAQWIAAPSGGTAYANPIDEPPTTPHAMDDEFDGTSLDAKWSWVNQGAATINVDGKKMVMTLPSMSDTFSGILQPAPSGNFTVTSKVQMYALASANKYNNNAIAIYNSANSRAVLIGKCVRPSIRGVQSSKPKTADLYLEGGWGEAWLYVKIIKSDTGYSLQFSHDGAIWLTTFTENITTWIGAITHIGVLCNKSDSSTSYGICDWFRVTEP